MNWKDPLAFDAPLGVPLIVTIKASWKHWSEVLGPVYRLKNHANGGVEYLNFGAGAELGTIENSVIGPNEVRVVAWDFWPEACEEGIAATSAEDAMVYSSDNSHMSLKEMGFSTWTYNRFIFAFSRKCIDYEIKTAADVLKWYRRRKHEEIGMGAKHTEEVRLKLIELGLLSEEADN